MCHVTKINYIKLKNLSVAIMPLYIVLKNSFNKIHKLSNLSPQKKHKSYINANKGVYYMLLYTW